MALTPLKPRLTPLRSRLEDLRAAVCEADTDLDTRPWRKWYSTARWRRLRLSIFDRDGFTCQWPGCGHVEGDTSKLVADHKQAHRGDEALFWAEGNLWTLCKPCHDGPKQQAEQAGVVRRRW